MKEEQKTFQFAKDYKFFKRGQYLEVPTKAFTGQWRIEKIWDELEELLKDGIVIDLSPTSKK